MKRPACFSVADRRVSKLRDGWGQPFRRHVESAGAKDALRPTCSGRNARRSPSQMSNGRSDQLQPQDQCPAREGPTSNFNRQTGVRGVKDQRQTSTAGREPRTKDQGQLRRFGPSCVRRTNVKLRSGSIPSWETLWSTRATGITHPGFYGWKPWKSLTTHPLLPHLEPDVKGFAVQPPKSFNLVTENVRKSSHSSSRATTHFGAGYRRQSPRVTTRLTLRRSSAFLRALRVS